MKIASSIIRPSSSFTGNVLKLMTGTAVAQILAILISPIITRLFLPEAFGIATIFTSITGIIGSIVCLRYNLAIMLPKTHEEAANILAVSLCATIFFTILSTVIIIFASDIILRFINVVELKHYLWLIPVSVFFTGVSLSLNYWNSRTNRFEQLSIIQIISSFAIQFTRLAAGFLGFVSAGVLILTTVMGTVVSAGALSGMIWRDDKKLLIDSVRLRKIADGFNRFKKFPVIDMWGALLNAVSWQLPALMLSFFFSTATVGFYALGLTVIKSPLGIVAGALSQVFYQKSSENKNSHGSNGEMVEKLIDTLMFLGILPTIILAMAGEEFFAVVFGARWQEAGLYTQILAPWMFFWFISSPLSSLFSVYERQGAALSAHSFIFITRVISLYIGGVYQNIYLALGLFSATGIVVYTIVAAWNIRLSKANGRKIISNFFKYCFYALPVVIFLFLVKYVFQLSQFVILASSFSIIVIYLLVNKRSYASILSNSFYKNGKV